MTEALESTGGFTPSRAVMSARLEPKDGLDDFPTPPWGTRALCELLAKRDLIDEGMICAEPSANRGHMVRPLQEYFGAVAASDIADYGAGFEVMDYLTAQRLAPVHWTITNPPFNRAAEFIARALENSTDGVAMLVRNSFLEGEGRYNGIYSKIPPRHVLQFTERLVMQKGKLPNPNKSVRVWDEKKQAFVMRRPSTATSYQWLIWTRGYMAPVPDFPPPAPRLHWTGVCRKRLERDGDYPDE